MGCFVGDVLPQREEKTDIEVLWLFQQDWLSFIDPGIVGRAVVVIAIYVLPAKDIGGREVDDQLLVRQDGPAHISGVKLRSTAAHEALPVGIVVGTTTGITLRDADHAPQSVEIGVADADGGVVSGDIMRLHRNRVVQVSAPAVVEGVGDHVVPMFQEHPVVIKKVDTAAVALPFGGVSQLLLPEGQSLVILVVSLSPEDLLILLIIDTQQVLQVAFVGERTVTDQIIVAGHLLIAASHSRKDEVVQLVTQCQTGQQCNIVVEGGVLPSHRCVEQQVFQEVEVA